MKTFKTSLAACGLVAALAACGDDASKPAGDATTTTDGTTTDSTTSTNTSTATDAQGDTSGPTCDETGITVATQFLDYDPETDVTRYEGATSGETVDALLVQFYPPLDGSAPSPLTGPGTYEIGANEADRNFETCEICVLAFKNCVEDEGCDKTFFATAGTITVTALDQGEMVFVGTLTNATLVEVTLDEETSASTPVPDGDTWCIPNFAFDSTPECITGFDCTAQEPVCEQVGLTCVAEIDECTSGDDANEPNDGPLGATPITIGEAKAAAACTGTTEQELDWYKFTTTGEKNLSAKVTWENLDASFFVLFVSSDEEVVGALEDSGEGFDEQFLGLAPAGTYYAVVFPSDTSSVGGGATAVAYSLTVTESTPECSSTVACTGGEPVCNLERGECVVCVSDFDCTTATPACLISDEGVASCGAVALCTGDDEPDADDGPTAAKVVTLDAAATSAKVCGESGGATEDESDWYKLDLAAVTDVTFTLAWEGDADLDVSVYDAEGVGVGESIFDQPEVLDLADLAIGTYYVEVRAFDGADTAAVAYTIRATTTAP